MKYLQFGKSFKIFAISRILILPLQSGTELWVYASYWNRVKYVKRGAYPT